MDREVAIQSRTGKTAKGFLGDRFHFGSVKNAHAVFSVSHLFLGEGGAKDILGERLPVMAVVTSDLKTYAKDIYKEQKQC